MTRTSRRNIIGVIRTKHMIIPTASGTTLEIESAVFDVIAIIKAPKYDGGALYVTNQKTGDIPGELSYLVFPAGDVEYFSPVVFPVNKKKINILRRLLEVMPDEFKKEWLFTNDNTGTALYSSYYGILCPLENGGLFSGPSLGINVEMNNSWRKRHQHGISDKKLGAVLAAWVSSANPETIGKLIDEIDLLHEKIDFLESELARLMLMME